MKKISFLIVLFTLSTQLIFAHAPEVVEMEATKIKFQFDTGETMYGSRITVKTKDGKKLYTGFVSKDGIFDYKKYVKEAYKIIVDDGEHFIEFTIPRNN